MLLLWRLQRLNQQLVSLLSLVLQEPMPLLLIWCKNNKSHLSYHHNLDKQEEQLTPWLCQWAKTLPKPNQCKWLPVAPRLVPKASLSLSQSRLSTRWLLPPWEFNRDLRLRWVLPILTLMVLSFLIKVLTISRITPTKTEQTDHQSLWKLPQQSQLWLAQLLETTISKRASKTCRSTIKNT